jgi:signal peptidase I
MLSTVILIALLLGLVIASFALSALLLHLGLRWAKVENVTIRRIAAAILFIFVVSMPLGVLARLLPESGPRALWLVLGVFVLSVGLSGLIIARIFRCSFLRALQAWVPNLVLGIVATPILSFAIRAYLVQAYYYPTNSMAPTILGPHWRAVCAECGQPSIVSPPPYLREGSSRTPCPTICGNFHTSTSADYDPRLVGPDRIFVAKYLSPRRWDIVVFRVPHDPAQVYCKRVVGLPGEEIRIDEGAVWADGRKLTPPESIRGITYTSRQPYSGGHVWGSPDNPARLAADEYFVLGDFSANSEDSRFWIKGAPGHPPYAVPASYISGVVTHIYWPPHRWRILR